MDIGLGTIPSCDSETQTTTPPSAAFTILSRANCFVETANWLSIGKTSSESSLPVRTSSGRLDSLLVLPIDSQFAVSTKQFALDSIVNAALGGVVVCIALSKLGVVPNLLSVLLYLAALCFGVAVHYSIMLGLAAVSFWIVRAQGLVYGYFNFLNIARYPDVIFPAVTDNFWVGRPGRDHCQHPRSSAHQIVWSTVSLDAASDCRVEHWVLVRRGVLAICAATLFQRQLVG